jgi:hypothetical protein
VHPAPHIAPAPPGLDKNGDNSSIGPDGGKIPYEVRRRHRFKLRSILRHISISTGQRGCGKWKIGSGPKGQNQGLLPVGLKRNPENLRAAETGLQHCRRNDCPTCGSKIAYGRSQEIEQGVSEAFGKGMGVYLGLLTFPHHPGQRLKALKKALYGSWGAAVSGRRRYTLRERYGLVGFIRAFEATHGKNGWHPHFHILWFFERPLTPQELASFEQTIFDAYAKGITDRGLERPLRGLCEVRPITGLNDGNKLGHYLAKVAGFEMGRSDLKQGDHEKGLNPFEILDRFGTGGDLDDYALWHEWEATMDGARRIEWSRGSKPLALPSLKSLLTVAERTDEEIADQELAWPEAHHFSSEQEDVWFAQSDAVRVAMLEIVGREGFRALRELIDHFADYEEARGP